RVRITSWNVGITNSCGKSGLKSPDEKSELYSNPDTRTRRKGGEHELSLVARCSLACAVHRARFRAGALGYGQGRGKNLQQAEGGLRRFGQDGRGTHQRAGPGELPFH